MPDYIDADFKDARPLWRRLRPRPAHLFAHKPDIMAKDYNGGLYVPAKPFWWSKRTWREWTALIFIGGPVTAAAIICAWGAVETIRDALHH